MKSVWQCNGPEAYHWRRLHQMAYDEYLPLPAPVRALLACYSKALYWRDRLDWFVKARGRRDGRHMPILVHKTSVPCR